MRILSNSMRFLFFLIIAELAYHGLAHADNRGYHQQVEHNKMGQRPFVISTNARNWQNANLEIIR